MEDDNKDKKIDVPFSAEQMTIIQKMLAEVRENTSSNRPDSVSMYNLRDPKSIETVNVRRIDGKFVIGFKDFQNDSFKKKPKYLNYKAVPERGLLREPFITLILSDGKEEITKEILLVDYVDQREYYRAKVLNIKLKKIIEDHGVLGSSGEYARAIDDRGKFLERPSILAQTEREERVFLVELPDFKEPVEFISDFLA